MTAMLDLIGALIAGFFGWVIFGLILSMTLQESNSGFSHPVTIIGAAIAFALGWKFSNKIIKWFLESINLN